MHAVVVSEPGGPDVLRWREVEDPAPGPGEVLLDVAASAVTRADLLQRRGRLRARPGLAQVIQQALEAYRTRFGDYPKVPDATMTGFGMARPRLPRGASSTWRST